MVASHEGVQSCGFMELQIRQASFPAVGDVYVERNYPRMGVLVRG
jgi:hypothetical protein